MNYILSGQIDKMNVTTSQSIDVPSGGCLITDTMSCLLSMIFYLGLIRAVMFVYYFMKVFRRCFRRKGYDLVSRYSGVGTVEHAYVFITGAANGNLVVLSFRDWQGVCKSVCITWIWTCIA